MSATDVVLMGLGAFHLLQMAFIAWILQAQAVLRANLTTLPTPAEWSELNQRIAALESNVTHIKDQTQAIYESLLRSSQA